MIPQIPARARGPLAMTAYEAGCNPSKSPDRVRVCVSYIGVGNLPCLQGGSPDYKSSSPQSIRGNQNYQQKPHNNTARLDIRSLHSGGPNQDKSSCS
jgi:hypothetical protein